MIISIFFIRESKNILSPKFFYNNNCTKETKKCCFPSFRQIFERTRGQEISDRDAAATKSVPRGLRASERANKGRRRKEKERRNNKKCGALPAAALGLGQWNNNTLSLAFLALGSGSRFPLQARARQIPRFTIFLFLAAHKNAYMRSQLGVRATNQPPPLESQRVHVHHFLEQFARSLDSNKSSTSELVELGQILAAAKIINPLLEKLSRQLFLQTFLANLRLFLRRWTFGTEISRIDAW